jgi:type II secretory pathway component PulF
MSFATKLLIGLSQGAVSYGPWILVLAVIIGVSIVQWRKTPTGRHALDTFCLRIPLVKYIFLNTDICRVSNLCATLLESGVNTTEAMRMTERSIQNTVVQSRFSAARMLSNDGASFSNAFKHYQVLPDLDLDMLSVGENTGNIAKSFREIYRNHSRELSEQFKLLTVLITTGALGCAFILVAILALGIVSAVLGMSKSLTGKH